MFHEKKPRGKSTFCSRNCLIVNPKKRLLQNLRLDQVQFYTDSFFYYYCCYPGGVPPHILSTLPATAKKLQDTSKTNRNVSKKRLEYQPKPRLSRELPFYFYFRFQTLLEQERLVLCIFYKVIGLWFYINQNYSQIKIYWAVTQTYVFSTFSLFSGEKKSKQKTVYCVGVGVGGCLKRY